MSFGRQQSSYTFPSVDHATLSEGAQDYCNGKNEHLWPPSLSLLVENSEEHPGRDTLESATPLSLLSYPRYVQAGSIIIPLLTMDISQK